MAGFTDLIEQATHRLSRDRELRLEVSRELESHLEASMAEFLEADYSEEDARAAAVKAFGTPEDVADELWAANRFRLKWRAWAWWLARLTLLPTCLLATVLFVISGVVSAPTLSGDLGSHNGWVESRIKSNMTEQQRLIFYGDESAADEVSRWRALRDAYPDEVMYQLDLITAMLSSLGADEAKDPQVFAARRGALVVELERGERMDPDNGVYAMLRAGLPVWGVRLGDAEEGEDVRAETVMVLPKESGDERTVQEYVERWPLSADETLLDEVIYWVEVAADKPYITMHTADRVRHRLEQLPPARSMQEYVMRVNLEISTVLPSLGLSRSVARSVAAEALRRVDAGDTEGAVVALNQLDAVAMKLSASSDILITLFVAWSIEALERQGRVAVWQVAGDESRAEEARLDNDRLNRLWQREWYGALEASEQDEMIRRNGVLMGQMMTAIPGYDVDASAFRKGEYAMLDRVALTLGLVVLVIVSGLASLAGGLSLWRAQRVRRADTEGVEASGASGGGGAVLMWLGWKRMVGVLAAAVGLPVLGFMLWSSLPWSGRGYGLNYNPAPVMAYLPVLLAVLLLLWEAGCRAMWGRAKALGMAVPRRRGWVSGGGMLAVMLMMSFTVWGSFWWSDRGAQTLGWSIANAVAIAVASIYALAWIGREIVWLRGIKDPRRAVKRSTLEGLVVATVVMVLFAGFVGYVVFPPSDRGPLTVFLFCVAILIGWLVGLFGLANSPGRSAWFARSVVRSMGPVLAIAGLVLVFTVGLGLNLRERALAGEMVEMSPVWFDMEIERSNAKVVRAVLAGDAPRPPRRP